MNRIQWGLHRARKGLRHPRQVFLALNRRVVAVVYAKRIRGLMELEWYAANRGISGRNWRRVVYDYARRGIPRGADPHPLFSSEWYLHHNPEIVAEGSNPLVHYVLTGESTGRSPHPLFDPDHYQICAGAGQSSGLTHFLASGDQDGLSPHPSFEPEHYRAQLVAHADPTFTAFLMDPTPRSAPNPWFDPVWYVRRYPTVADEEINPLRHYETVGRAQDYHPSPMREMIRRGESGHRDPADPARPLPLETSGGLKDEVLDETKRRSATIVTFDVWDTLLRRDTAPDALKLQSARLLWLLGRDALKDNPSVLDLYRARRAAETSTSRGPDREYRWADAARALVRESARADVPDDEQEPLIEALTAHEVDAEIYASRSDATATSLLTQLASEGVRIGLISDFYLSSVELGRILASAELPAVASFTRVSSDAGISKRSGRLFDAIRTEMDLASSSWVHVGDSLKADVIAARESGIGAVHYVNNYELELRDHHEESLRGLLRGDPLAAQEAIVREITTASCRQLGGTASEADLNGIHLAPLIGGYALFALEQALRTGVDTLYCFTREGELVGEAVKELIDHDVFGVAATEYDYPEVAVLEVSRLATFNASLDAIDPASLMRMWTMYPTQSPIALGKSLKVPPEVVSAACRRLGVRPDEEISHPWESQTIRDLLADREFLTTATNQRLLDREALLQYLESQGIDRDGSEPLTVLDLGWRGTIQDNIAYLLPDRAIHGAYLGLLRYLNPQPPNVSKSAWLFDMNKGDELGGHMTASAIETLFNAAGGSVVGYSTGDENTVTRDVLKDEEAALEEAFRPVQGAALAVLPHFARRVRLDGVTSDSLRSIGFLRLHEYLDYPLSTLANGFERVQHNQTFGLGTRVKSNDNPIHLDVNEGSAPFFSRIAADVSTAPWPAARARLVDDHAETKLADAYRDWMPRQVRGLEPGFNDLVGARASVYLPVFNEQFGSHRAIARFAAKLAGYGLETTLVLESLSDEGGQTLADSLGGASVSVGFGGIQAAHCDIAIATSTRAMPLVANLSGAAQRAFLVQDFEASSDTITARHLYDEISSTHGVAHLTIGRWLPHFLRTELGSAAAGSGPGVDHGVYYSNGRERGNTMCVLYQPERSHAAAELVLETLRCFRSVRPDVEILVFGSEAKLPADLLTTHLGPIADLNEMNDMYNRSKTALCVPPNNPPRFPFELMAAGVVPVAPYRYRNLFDYADGTGILAYGSPESLARALSSLLEEDQEFSRHSLACVNHAASLTNEWESEVLVNGVMTLLARGRLRQPPVTLSYSAPPLVAEADRSRETEAFLADQRRRGSAPAPSDSTPS